MENEGANKNGLLRELVRLVKSAEKGDFSITLSESNLSEEEAQAIRLINMVHKKYQKTIEYDLMKYKLTSDALSIALWDMDISVEDPVSPNNKFTWSKEFRKMLGFSDESDFPNLLSSWSDRLHPDDKARTLEAFAAHITDMTGKTPYDIEYKLMTKNGEYRHYHAYGNTLRNPAGIPLRVAGALLDITEKVDMAEALGQALEETKLASNAKSEFLANMSHEMRTPLNAIIGLSGLSIENDWIDEETRSNLEKVHNAGTTLLSIVNDLLDISKIESGKFELIQTDFCVPSLINDAITQNLLRIGEKPIELKLNIKEDMYSRLYGDELRIRQIINNLLTNAIKYTSEGEVELTTSCAKEKSALWLTIKVRDTGHGIKQEDIEKLFSDYSQVDTKANRKIEGTGLGLSITKRLCELMDGSIAVESKYGKGSVFTARIKVKIVSDIRIDPETVENLKNLRYFDDRRDLDNQLERINLSYAHVLVVDDNLTNLDVARGLMKPYGMNIDCVDSGQKAIDAIAVKEGKYDAIFMDQMMPGMDGIEATRLIRELDSDYAKNIPIIALTANAIVGNEKKFLSKGFQAFLSKPIDISRLDTVIKHWVRNKEKEELSLQGGGELSLTASGQKSSLINKQVTGINLVKGLQRFGGNEESYLTVLRAYAVNTRSLLATIETISEDSIKSYEITVHGIKGSSSSLCVDSLADFAKKLETAAKTGDWEYIKKHNPQFLGAAFKFISDLEGMFAAIYSENPKPKKSKPDDTALSKLIIACNRFDMDGVDKAMEEITGYEYDADDGLVKWLVKNVDQMNFSEIVERLSNH